MKKNITEDKLIQEIADILSQWDTQSIVDLYNLRIASKPSLEVKDEKIYIEESENILVDLEYREIKKYLIYDIKWYPDGEKVKLPKKVIMYSDKDVQEEGHDKLSNEYGFCVFSFKLKQI